MSNNSIIDFRNPGPWRKRKRRQTFVLGVLTLLTCVAWVLVLKWEEADATVRKPVVIRGGNAWQGERGVRFSAMGGLSGRVTHVRDGDTIEIGHVAVRLAQLDCAELGTPQGERAKLRMQELVGSGVLHCRLNGETSYDREVGSCRLRDGRDIGQILISESVCRNWH